MLSRFQMVQRGQNNLKEAIVMSNVAVISASHNDAPLPRNAGFTTLRIPHDNDDSDVWIFYGAK